MLKKPPGPYSFAFLRNRQRKGLVKSTLKRSRKLAPLGIKVAKGVDQRVKGFTTDCVALGGSKVLEDLTVRGSAVEKASST